MLQVYGVDTNTVMRHNRIIISNKTLFIADLNYSITNSSVTTGMGNKLTGMLLWNNYLYRYVKLGMILSIK